ncbi:MAG: SHD1 domain-containing protein [Planctomycetota bacterium]
MTAATLIFAFPHVSHSQTRLYEPRVGQTYEYGIEIRALEGKAAGRTKPERIVKRMRVTYQIVDVSDGLLRMAYQSNPFQGSGPAESPEAVAKNFERSAERASTSLANRTWTTESGQSLPAEAQARLQRSHQRMDLLAKQRHEMLVTDHKVYPGIIRFCSGTIQMTPRGTEIKQSGNANLPWLSGQLPRIPFVEYPEDPDSLSFGYKQVVPFRMVDKEGKNAVETVANLLHSLAKASDAGPNGQIQFDRDFELLAGGDLGRDIQVSGNGYWEAASTNGMPVSGLVQSTVKGLGYRDHGRQWTVRVSFLYLKPWQKVLFDNWMTPVKEALSAECLPRLDDKLLHQFAKSLEDDPDRRIRDNPFDGVSWGSFSPPLWDGPAETKLRELGETKEGDKAIIENLRYSRLTWKQLRKAARVVPRTWSDRSGSFEVDATLSHREGDVICLTRVSDQKPILVPLSSLSEKDQDIARRFALPESPDAPAQD